ncbi:unnamed protein product [Vitrella brassicaformis CCMP3155]|uniref:Glutamine amidotransferase domain-containing protein n=2 Tax=Vitrella brassicaformis TaxID=1169539 RepID=A0A0G4EZ67_VITBC|nr:unnamed protein product [Vitrella brassicaformis CCMP3155]|mmetsp:Transcript_53514/g.134706  ORF Transcript_53514/g.134706 Transcript_53514/m.134706 type:complete len:272 (+) Transcript_53514:113-928(+)|eukprot:CEM04067.1 unnamed protein product [Vitrella brassicaformis CCMP3155]
MEKAVVDKPRLRVALLVTEDDQVYGVHIVDMFREWLEDAMDGSTILCMDAFDAKKMEWPAQHTWQQYDGFIIPGSLNSAYDKEPWIEELARVIQKLHADRTPFLGVCFGHQLAAQALGGRVKKNPMGTQFSRITTPLINTAPAALPLPLVKDNASGGEISLLYSHDDVVVEAPSVGVSLGGTEACPVIGVAYGSPPFAITVQGHPEFNTKTGKGCLDVIFEYYVKVGKATPEQVEEGRRRAAEPTDAHHVAKAVIGLFSRREGRSDSLSRG